MQRHELEHILRASAAITGADRFVVIGSQAVLGQFADAPPELLMSNEADIVSLRGDEDADLIDGTIGELSPFHTTFGYYAHGVSNAVATLPDGWRERLIALRSENTGGATGLCLEAHDLAVSKLVAGRKKDLEFIAALLRHRLVSADVIHQRLAATMLDDQRRTLCASRLARLESA